MIELMTQQFVLMFVGFLT